MKRFVCACRRRDTGVLRRLLFAPQPDPTAPPTRRADLRCVPRPSLPGSRSGLRARRLHLSARLPTESVRVQLQVETQRATVG